MSNVLDQLILKKAGLEKRFPDICVPDICSCDDITMKKIIKFIHLISKNKTLN